MAHERFEFHMPASADVVFDAFHFIELRHRWDTLVGRSRVADGAPCPYVGAITENQGGRWLGALSMRTRFVSFERPRLAAAAMEGRAFPFRRWAASMRHVPLDAQRSTLVYTYQFEAGPPMLRWLMEPVVKWIFDRQTRLRFARLAQHLAAHRGEIEAWQQARGLR